MLKHTKMLFLWCCALVILLNNGGVTYVLGLNQINEACIIGAGYSGLGAARYLKEYGVDFKVFEATRHVGGTWRFDPHVGTDEDGVPVFTSMYKNLRTNNPRQTMEYANFPFPEGTPSYPSATCVYRYLKNFTKEFNIAKYIQFRTLVTLVKWAGTLWEVTYHRTDTQINHTEVCKHVIVATGNLRKPHLPSFKGLQSFQGNVIHSHDYKDSASYKGRRVLIVGAGASGLDLATLLSNVTLKLVHSHHLVYNEPYFGPNYIKKPDIKMFTTDGVVFKDESFEQVDDVILCTGYRYEFKFLHKNCGIISSEMFVVPLYQHMVNVIQPSMVFVGIAKKVITRVYDAQAQYAAALIAKKFALPSRKQMFRSWLELWNSLEKNGLTDRVNVIGKYTNDYFANMTKEAGVIRPPPVLMDIVDFKNRFEDLLNYRDYDYKFPDDYSFKRFYNPRNSTSCPIEDITGNR